MKSAALKSFTSQAKCVLNREASKLWIGAAPLTPLMRLFHVASRVLPTGGDGTETGDDYSFEFHRVRGLVGDA